MSPRARSLRDRADVLSRWADRILADRPHLTAAPRCPTCRELVSPGAWDLHQREHRTDADTYQKEVGP